MLMFSACPKEKHAAARCVEEAAGCTCCRLMMWSRVTSVPVMCQSGLLESLTNYKPGPGFFFVVVSKRRSSGCFDVVLRRKKKKLDAQKNQKVL